MHVYGIIDYEIRICPMRAQPRHLGMTSSFPYGGQMHARTSVGRVEKTRTRSGADGGDNQTVGSTINADGRWKRKDTRNQAYCKNTKKIDINAATNIEDEISTLSNTEHDTCNFLNLSHQRMSTRVILLFWKAKGLEKCLKMLQDCGPFNFK